MRTLNDDHRIAATLGVPESALAVERRSIPDHIHDFHTGRNPGARCTICKVKLVDSGLQSGGKVVGPQSGTDDDYRAPTGKDAPQRLSQTRLGGSAPVQYDTVALNRMDVVAHGWDLKRRPGEDDDHLATRIRRAAAGVPVRPPIPPMDWVPPAGYKLGDSWTVTSPSGHDVITIEAGEYEVVSVPGKHAKALDAMLGEPKKVN